MWKRFRSGVDGFTFTRNDNHYEVHVAANAERVVDLFYTLTEHLSPAVDVALDDMRSDAHWHGELVALPDVRDAIARLKVPLATYGGIEMAIYTPDDQITLTPHIELYIYSRSDKWLYLLQGKGLEEFGALGDKHSGAQPWDRSPAPSLTDAVASSAERLSLKPVQS